MSHGSVSATVPAQHRHASRSFVDINPSTANADIQSEFVELDDVTLPSDIIASVKRGGTVVLNIIDDGAKCKPSNFFFLFNVKISLNVV